MKTISPVALQQALESRPSLAVLDVRSHPEFIEVHAAPARNLPLDELSVETLAKAVELQRDQPVYLLCRSGQRATKAAQTLSKVGFAQPVVVEGGTLAWIAANLPVVRGNSSVISLERQVRIVAGALVFSGVAMGWLLHPGFYALAAFVGAGLVFAGITDFCGMGLLLAKAPWNKAPAR